MTNCDKITRLPYFVIICHYSKKILGCPITKTLTHKIAHTWILTGYERGSRDCRKSIQLLQFINSNYELYWLPHKNCKYLLGYGTYLFFVVWTRLSTNDDTGWWTCSKKGITKFQKKMKLVVENENFLCVENFFLFLNFIL